MSVISASRAGRKGPRGRFPFLALELLLALVYSSLQGVRTSAEGSGLSTRAHHAGNLAPKLRGDTLKRVRARFLVKHEVLRVGTIVPGSQCNPTQLKFSGQSDVCSWKHR